MIEGQLRTKTLPFFIMTIMDREVLILDSSGGVSLDRLINLSNLLCCMSTDSKYDTSFLLTFTPPPSSYKTSWLNMISCLARYMGLSDHNSFLQSRSPLSCQIKRGLRKEVVKCISDKMAKGTKDMGNRIFIWKVRFFSISLE